MFIGTTNGDDYWYFEGRPEEPAFPVISLRIKGLGDDFLGIVSDIESDLLTNPSLTPLLKSNELNLTLLPYYKYGYYLNQNSVSSSLLFPLTFIPKLSFGLHNQLVYSGSGEYRKYYYYYDNSFNSPRYHEYSQSDFLSYQQIVFLAFSLSPSVKLAPFYTFSNSPYTNEGEGSYEDYTIENGDTIYGYRNLSHGRSDDDFFYHRFGFGGTFDFGKNSLQLVGSWKTGENQINANSEGEHYNISSYGYSYTYDSSYYYHFHHYRHLESDTTITEKLINFDEIKITLRWQRRIDDKQSLNTILDLSNTSFNPSGSEFEVSNDISRDSLYERWRNYPNLESTRTEIDTPYGYYQKSLSLSGHTIITKAVLGLGYETPLTNNLQGFIGVKSVFNIEKDSSQRLGSEIIKNMSPYRIPVLFDTTTDTNQVFTFDVTNRKGFYISLPLGFEYKILPFMTIRAGITPKVSYEKIGLKTEQGINPDITNKNIDLSYSFGTNIKLGRRLSIDGYNGGNLFTVRDWIVQMRYKL